jgi:apolipoprotein N-acyltransferase
VAWVGLEFLRSTQSETFAGTWGNISYALYERPALLQPISVTGIWGINLLILAVNWAIAALVIAWLDRRALPPEGSPTFAWPRAKTGAIAVASVLALWTIAGIVMIDDARPSLTVGAVQPGSGLVVNARNGEEWNQLSDEEELERDVEDTLRAGERGADLVVWREGGLGMDLREADVNEPIRRAAKKAGTYIAAGWRGNYDGLNLNEVATFSPQGKFLGTYGKSHPGTFAGDLSDRRSDYIVYDAPFGRFGSIICYDLDFTDSAREVARRRAEILAVSSADVPGIAQKHYAHLVFRSIETNLPTVKADNTFDSSIIDPWGRIIDRHVSPSGSRALLVADIAKGTGDTIYVRFGDWVGIACAIGLVLIGVGGLIVRLRSRARRVS